MCLSPALFGLPTDQVVGRRCHALLHGTDVPWPECPVGRALQTKRRAEAEINLATRGLWLLASADPVLDEAGNVLHVVHVLEDITERKSAKAAVDRQVRFERLISGISARLMQASTDQVTPEIREALREIRAFLELDRLSLFEVTADQASVKRVESRIAPGCDPPLPGRIDVVSAFPWVFDHVVRLGHCFLAPRVHDLPAEAEPDRTNGLAHGIRSFLAIPLSVSAAVGYVITGIAIRREHVGLEGYIPRLRLLGDMLVNARVRQQAEVEARNLRDQLAHVARAVTLVLDRAPQLLPVLGDPIQLQQVLLNLIANAMDALEAVPAGQRHLRVSTHEPRPGLLQAAVCDVGTGIAPERLSGIFEPFCTTKPGGLGMGLAICRSILQVRHGTIEAVNNSDRGATVRFTLPALDVVPP